MTPYYNLYRDGVIYKAGIPANSIRIENPGASVWSVSYVDSQGRETAPSLAIALPVDPNRHKGEMYCEAAPASSVALELVQPSGWFVDIFLSSDGWSLFSGQYASANIFAGASGGTLLCAKNNVYPTSPDEGDYESREGAHATKTFLNCRAADAEITYQLDPTADMSIKVNGVVLFSEVDGDLSMRTVNFPVSAGTCIIDILGGMPRMADVSTGVAVYRLKIPVEFT